MPFKFTPQHDKMDCGPACLAMIASFYNKEYSLQFLREHSFLTKEGVSFLGLIEASTKIGFKSIPVTLSLSQLIEKKDALPCVIHWNKNHFVVLKKISKSLITGRYYFQIADPSYGMITLREDNFKKSWITNDNTGLALLLYTTKEFDMRIPEKKDDISIRYLFKYLRPYSAQISITFLLLLLGSLLNLILPFLTQNLIDKGVNGKDFNIIYLILLAQLGVYTGTIIIEIFRNWLVLFVGTKISITIISDFLKKLLQLPIKFFDTKMAGDFNQRIQDNERIEHFLTSQSLLTFFSIVTFFVFFGVLWYYDYTILLVYLSMTILSVSWSFYWLRKKVILDYLKFQHRGENQGAIYEIITGVTEMKLNQFEDFKRNQWRKIQQKLFKVNIRILKIDQIQLSGFDFVNQIKNILITFLAANLVIKGQMTLGELLSVSYIVGQMNSPVDQFIDFIRSLQNAKLSLERLNEVQNHRSEDDLTMNSLNINSLDGGKNGIDLVNVSFQYEGPHSPFVLKDIDLFIPEGKVTAIVGASGSGKTTLMKLLLKFYQPSIGTIFYNGSDITRLSSSSLRKNCGVVMQDGFIFSDTIARNIATRDTNISTEKLENSIKIANIQEFIGRFPLKYNTKIGTAGNGISGGQKQRILIARAVYKSPHYIFFDEATSALDAENEKVIHDNLQEFFKNKTVIIIAHRLSTVKRADQIIVLKEGQIIERGSHQELVLMKREYYKLIKNQLELGT
jgi:ATP-binding cassette subfamily B protein